MPQLLHINCVLRVSSFHFHFGYKPGGLMTGNQLLICKRLYLCTQEQGLNSCPPIALPRLHITCSTKLASRPFNGNHRKLYAMTYILFICDLFHAEGLRDAYRQGASEYRVPTDDRVSEFTCNIRNIARRPWRLTVIVNAQDHTTIVREHSITEKIYNLIWVRILVRDIKHTGWYSLGSDSAFSFTHRNLKIPLSWYPFRSNNLQMIFTEARQCSW